MHISLDIEPVILILLGITIVFSVIYMIWDYMNYRSLKNAVDDTDASGSWSAGEQQGVSVIVYADNNTSLLAKNLPLILDQDYPLYEVIVVNDGKNESTADFMERFSQEHPNLHYTYTPDDASKLSRKKLAIMVGIKAARYDIILTTNSNCAPQSRRWVSSVARHFNGGAEVVVGYSRMVDNDTKRGYRFRSFMFVKNSVKYLVQAIQGKPYRGISDNLAYSKTLFFKNKGFSRSMSLHYGEDDLFVNEIATHANTRVELSPESIVLAKYDYPERMFGMLKLRHTFSERKIRSSAFVKSAIMTCLYISSLLIGFSTIAMGYNNLLTIAAPVVMMALMIAVQIVMYRKVAGILQMRKLMFSVPLFALLQPIVNCYYKLKSMRHTSYFYTWQPLRN